MKNLCLAGGVALNCVANGKVLRDGSFDRIWIQPAAGDAGGALGAALAACHLYKAQPRHVNGCGDRMKGAYLGPCFFQADIGMPHFAHFAGRRGVIGVLLVLRAVVISSRDTTLMKRRLGVVGLKLFIGMIVCAPR